MPRKQQENSSSSNNGNNKHQTSNNNKQQQTSNKQQHISIAKQRCRTHLAPEILVECLQRFPFVRVPDTILRTVRVPDMFHRTEPRVGFAIRAQDQARAATVPPLDGRKAEQEGQKNNTYLRRGYATHSVRAPLGRRAGKDYSRCSHVSLSLSRSASVWFRCP